MDDWRDSGEEERINGTSGIVHYIESHKAVQKVTQTQSSNGLLRISIGIHVRLPLVWRNAGTTPTGVRAVELVDLVFSQSDPFAPPKILLRSDFNRELAHIQPGRSTQRL